MKCLLHIGVEKTGTTTLQNFFVVNSTALKRLGYVYTESAGYGNNWRLAVAAYDCSRRDHFTLINNLKTDADLIGFQAAVVNDLKNELAPYANDTVIFSSEHFQSRLTTDSELLRLKGILQSLGFDDILIIVYLRDPVALAGSLYSTAVKTGADWASPPPPSEAYFRKVCDHRSTIERFCRVFGEDHVTPRIFDRSLLKNGSIIDDFLDAIGISPQNNLIFSPDKNVSLSVLGLELLRRINQLIPVFIDDQENPLREGLVEYFEEHFKGSYAMPATLAKRYDEEFFDSNEWVRGVYFPDRSRLFPLQMTSLNTEMPQEVYLDDVAKRIAESWSRPIKNLDIFRKRG